MNNFLGTPIKTTLNYVTISFMALLLSACADTRIVILEDSVKQQHNLTDYDSDGVIKARDKCAETTIGALIDNNGCGTSIANIKPFKIDIKFANNSYEIPNAAYSEIEKLAEVLEKYPSVNVIVEGHTSKVGSTVLNQILSDKRAQSVALVLENNFNIDKNRISSFGYGFERRAVIDDTEQAHIANRRIMAEISYTESIDELKWTIYTVDEAN